MARAVTVGNGNILVGLDSRGQVRDFYYPYVGHSNHVSGASGSYVHRIGVYVNGSLSWLDDDGWEIAISCSDEAAVGTFTALHARLGVTLESIDVVHNEYDVFMRQFKLRNDRPESREIKLFLAQQFRISESRRGDTGFFDPLSGGIIHYKGHSKFLINAFHGEVQFVDYNIGLFGIEGREGTYFDANDGVLERNPIEHGSVDSIIGVGCELKGGQSTTIAYWIACASTLDEVRALDARVRGESPEVLIRSTQNYWKAWMSKVPESLTLLADDLARLYRRSLSTIRVHMDNRGGIIASSDTDMLHHGRDTYGYVWPRDASVIANALDRAGYSDVSKRFFRFIAGLIEREGYLMHKYRVDGVLGSSWHPWMQDGKARLPIQEDETALPLYMLWRHYEVAQDLEFIESLYNPFIEPAADFMCEYIQPELGLPDDSYDLWEEKYGASTYTASAVYAALMAAGKFANMLGKNDAAMKYQSVAERIREGIVEHLFDSETGVFIKLIGKLPNNEFRHDVTVDISSFFGVIYFGVLDAEDQRVERSARVVEERLRIHGNSDGYIRYENDTYYKMQDAESPNPWVITTLWMAQYYIRVAKNTDELARAYEILKWTHSHATPSGMLAEQVHPRARTPLSTAPLIWSHAEFVITVDEYLKKLTELTKAD